MAAVLATDLTRAAIFGAIRHRRTYAVTGDRIRLDFQVNGRTMGAEMPYVKQRDLAVSVTGWDQLDRVEILKNNRVLHQGRRAEGPREPRDAGDCVPATADHGVADAELPATGRKRGDAVNQIAWSSPIWVNPPAGGSGA